MKSTYLICFEIYIFFKLNLEVKIIKKCIFNFCKKYKEINKIYLFIVL